MVKFVPRKLKDNVNISPISPKREFFSLVAAFVGIGVLVYIFLGIALNIIIDKWPNKVEGVLCSLMKWDEFKTPEKFVSAEKKTQEILDSLVVLLPGDMHCYRYRVHIVEEKSANALALPCGHIVVFSGLLKEIDSENELAMVLAHELGHFVHKDHLRAMGRGVVFTFISALLFGANSAVTDFVAGTISAVDLHFSREQEMAADRFALGLVNARYGNIAGALDFFKKQQVRNKSWGIFYLFSDHPSDSDRITALKRLATKRHYINTYTIPLNSVYNIFKQ